MNNQSYTDYGDDFYSRQMGKSYFSAARFCGHLLNSLSISSVVDVGCGRGTWSKAFLDSGVSRSVGIDGPWNRQEFMCDPRIEFFPCDFDSGFSSIAEGKFDLAISVEVAEHLAPSTAPSFVGYLTKFSDVVVFGAACPGQGGINHINERWQSYWGQLFSDCEYDVFDFFRGKFWGDSEIPFWYRQNTFLFVKRGSLVHESIIQSGLIPMKDLAFMDVVHPDLHEYLASRTILERLLSWTYLRTPKFLLPIGRIVAKWVRLLGKRPHVNG